MAEMTSIFVTPFPWLMRFGFFCALVGGLMLLIVWQTKEL
jgi:hypothetical protein